jgi:SAM-dependent methyltransferase/uncharacterized protein YndB with AHSA1/START domain
METTIAVSAVLAGDRDSAFSAFVDELTEALERRGLALEGGPRGVVAEGGRTVGSVREWRPGVRILLEWRGADWADDVTEIEARFEPAEGGTGVTLEHRGFGRVLFQDADAAGWFADAVVAPLLASSAPEGLGDWLTDRAARRPSGVPQREGYRDPTHHRPSFGAVLEALELGEDDVLLEIGAGGGAFLQDALRFCDRAAAVDHSREMLRVARELNAGAVEDGRLELCEGDAAALPFADDRFTCAAMMQVFFFLPDPGGALAECRRVLRPGGRLAVFTVSEQARGTPAAPEPMASRARFYTDDELVELARNAGFPHARVVHPDLERHARAAGLADDVVALFAGDPAGSQLLVAT